MKINSIQNFNYNNNMAFKGLWGKKTVSNCSENGTDCYNIQYKYYPFSDESDKEINKVVKQYTTCFSYRIPKGNDWKLQQETYKTNVNVEKKLPFTRQDFVDFQKDKSTKSKKTVIENYITHKKLSDDID